MGNSFSTTTASSDIAPIATALVGPSYSTIGEFYLRFGQGTINQISDAVGDGDQSEINNRIQQGLNQGYAQVNGDFQRTNSRIPLSADPSGTLLIKKWEQDEAINWLYEMRGARDKDHEGNQFAPMVEASRKERAMYVRGDRVLNAASRKWPTATSPVTV